MLIIFLVKLEEFIRVERVGYFPSVDMLWFGRESSRRILF